MIIRDRSFLERQQTARSESSAFVLLQRAQQKKWPFASGQCLSKILINMIHGTSSVFTSITQVQMTLGKIFPLSQFTKLSKRVLHIHKRKEVINFRTQRWISGISMSTFTCMKKARCAGCMQSHTDQADQHKSVQSRVIIKKLLLLLYKKKNNV